MPRGMSKDSITVYSARREGRINDLEARVKNLELELDNTHALVTRLADRVHYLIEERQSKIQERRNAETITLAHACKTGT